MRLLKQATDRQGSVVCFCVATAVVTRGWLGRRAWVLLYMRAELYSGVMETLMFWAGWWEWLPNNSNVLSGHQLCI